MKLPFIGEVVSREHHEEVVRELRSQVTRLEADRRLAWNRLFETVQGIPLDEALATAGEPAHAAEPAPHQRAVARDPDDDQAFQSSRLGHLLSIAGRRVSKIVRHTTLENARKYNRADEKKKVAEMFDLARLKAAEDAEEAQRKRDLLDAAADKPTPQEAATTTA